LAAWDARLARCAAEGPILLAVHETLAIAPLSNPAWYLRWGEPPGQGIAFSLGTEQAHPALGPQTPTEPLELAQWRAVWLGKVRLWAELNPRWPSTPIYPIAPWPESALGQGLTTLVGPRWRHHPRAVLAPDPETALNILARTPGSVGWLPRGWFAWRAAQGDPRTQHVHMVDTPMWRAPVVLWHPTSENLSIAVQRWISCLQYGGE